MNVCIHQSKVRTIRNTERNEVSSAERSVHKSKVSDELRPFPLGYAGGRCGGVGKLEEPVYCSGDAGSDTAKKRSSQYLPAQGVHLDVPSFLYDLPPLFRQHCPAGRVPVIVTLVEVHEVLEV